MTKEIKLTRGQTALVDDWWFDYLMQWKWQARWDPHTGCYYARAQDKDGKLLHMHRIVARTPPNLICDHINQKTLDCREENLRNVTYSQNAMNRRFRSKNKLGLRSIHLENGRYRVIIQKEGKRVFCKRFDDIEEAIEARDAALEKYHGEYSGLHIYRQELDLLKLSDGRPSRRSAKFDTKGG